MIFVVTPLYALPVAAIYLALWMRVSAMRGATGMSFGNVSCSHMKFQK
ncbi:hypothetical protein [Ahrensia kielensis]